MHQVDNLEILRCFAQLHRERHLSRAALRVGLSQPAMSRALARLRTTFADELFVRTPAGMIPTARADALAPRVHDLLAAADALVRAPDFDPARLVRTFVIAAAGFAETQFLPPLVASLAREAPGVSITVRPVGGGLEDRVDLVIAIRDTLPNDARHVQLYIESFACAVREDHPCKRLTLARYVKLAHLVVAPGDRPGGRIDSALARHDLVRRVAVRVHTFPLAPAIVAASDLIITAPRRSLAAVAHAHRLRLMAPPLELAHSGVFAAWHPRLHADPAHVWFRGKLLAACRQRVAA
jgi:DNA-binding transcriptional LysR family regulator